MSEAATTKKAVTKTKKNEVQTIGLASKFAQDAGMGMENVRSEDLVIPRIKLCHSISPQRKKTHEKYIPGLEEGDIFNTLTGEVWSMDKGVLVVPCAYRLTHTEWYPLEENKGIVGELDASDPRLKPNNIRSEDTPRRDFFIDSGMEYVKTAEHYVLILDPETGEHQQCLMPMTKSNLKHSRAWNTQMKMQSVPHGEGRINLPSFACIWHLGSIEVTKDNKSWHEYKIIGRHSIVESESLYESAKSFSELIQSGVSVAVDEDEQGTGPAAPEMKFD